MLLARGGARVEPLPFAVITALPALIKESQPHVVGTKASLFTRVIVLIQEQRLC